MTPSALNVDLQRVLEALVADLKSHPDKGEVATYIPELRAADPGLVGIAVALLDGRLYAAGDSDQTFSIQSISKSLNLDLSLHDFPLHVFHDFFTLIKGQPDVLRDKSISATIKSCDFFNGESFTGKAGLNPDDEFHGRWSLCLCWHLTVEFAPIVTVWLRHPQV